MYPGHFAFGLALKTVEPKAPTLAIMVGVGLLDLLFGLFVALGIEGGAIGHLNIPWSHSLAMALLWSVLFAALYRHQGRRIMAVMAIAVMSHWLLDLLSHAPDMLLWPMASGTIGLGSIFGGLAGWLEASICIGTTLWYVISARRAGLPIARLAIVCLVMALMYAAEYAAVS
jgi:membrane-bound metal-dependent hydrolase YbcI (DUF457 family)